MGQNRTIKLHWAAALPEAWRYLSIAWKPWRMAGAAAISVVFCFFFLALMFAAGKIPGGFSNNGVGYDLVFIIFIYHLAILWIYFPARVASSISQEWRDKTWVFQQTTPQGSLRFLAGRILGAPADGHIALVASWPVLIVALTLSKVPVLQFTAAYFVAVLFAFAFSIMTFYFSLHITQATARNEQAYVVPFAMMYLLSIPFFIAFEEVSRRTGVFSSILNLNPFSIFIPVFTKKSLAVPFFGYDVPWFPAIVVFFSVWLAWFVIASTAQLNVRMSRYSSRLPLVGLLCWLVFLIEGGLSSIKSNQIHPAMVSFFTLCTVLLCLLYIVVVVHSRPLQEIRPWLYQWRENPSGGYFFRTDSPVIFTFILLQALCIIALVADSMLHELKIIGAPNLIPVPWKPETRPMVYLAFFSITLRDCLLLQYWRLRREKKDWIIVLVYALGFVAIPALVNVATEKWIIDLTFADIYRIGLVNQKMSLATLLISPIINLIAAGIIAALTWRLIEKAHQGLPPELSGDK